MTVTGTGTGAGSGTPVIPAVAWSRAIGLPCPTVGHPRVPQPMIDDGEWAGVPVGGLGTGSIGRTFRGDFARWHLDIGRHVYDPIAADQFCLFVSGSDGAESSAVVLSTIRPTTLPSWGWTLPVGSGTYRALFPRAWFTFEPPDLPVRLVGEQLSPVIAGDYDASALPVGVFSWSIENPTDRPLTVGLMFSWQNPLGAPAGEEPLGGAIARVDDGADALAIEFRGPDDLPAGRRGTVAIAVARDDGVRVSHRARFDSRDGAETWADFAADGALDDVPDERPSAPGEPTAGALAATVSLAPGERREVRFSLAWDIPLAEFGGGRRWRKRYTRTWGAGGDRAVELARHALERADVWRAAIEAWQDPVLSDDERPAWYRAALFNELYFLVDGGSFWDDGEDGAAPPADGIGRFGLIECYDYPFYNTADVNFTASQALLELWPDLEVAGLRAHAAAVPYDDPTTVTIQATGLTAIRKLPGAVPHDVGGPDEDPFVRPNRYRYQDVNDWKDLGPKFVLQLWRDHRRLGLPELVRDAWPSVVGCLDALAAADHDGDGLPEHDGPDQTYDTWPMHGPSAYGGLLWLAALRAAVRMAAELGDDDAGRRFAARFEHAQASFEARLWAGDHYRYDGGMDPSSDSVMADQLSGQWAADVGDLGDLVAPERIDATLRTIHRLNVVGFAGGRMGAVNGVRPDGTVDGSSDQSAEVWVGTTYALAALMLGRGLDAEAWQTAEGAAAVTYERGLWFRTPEAYDANGDYRASLYLRPLAIWTIEEALRRRAG
jgi:non-lysosomal glucosylceramidase